MKKVLVILMAVMMLLGCAACGSKTSSADRLAKIKSQGYLEIYTEPYFAPYEFIDPTKAEGENIVGMDIEIAKYIAEKIGVELKITPLEFNAVLAGAADGKCDFAISAMAYSPVRAEAMNLSNVYYSSGTGYGFLTRAEDVEKYNSVESLEGATVITQSGSVQEALYNEQINGKVKIKEFKLVSSMTDGYLAVAEGKADVCVVSTASAQLYADANGGLAIPEFRLEVDPNMNGTCIGMAKQGTESLMEIVNQCIKELNDAGKIEAWRNEYTDYAVKLGIE